MAAPVYQSQTSTYLDNATILTASLAVPAGTASGDLLLYLWEVDGNVGLAVPTGFTSGHNSAGAAGGTFTTGWAWRVADGTETTITVETVNGSAERASVALARITGADTTTPIDGSAYGNSGSTAGQTATCPTYTTTVDDCLIVKAVGTESGNSSNPFAVWPTSTERYDNENGPPGGGSASAGLTVASATQASAGATGTEAVDISGTGNTHWGAYTIAIAPPASAGADVSGSGAATIGALAASGAGTLELSASGTTTLGAIAADGAGSIVVSGSGAATIGALEASGSGSLAQDVAGSGAGELPAFVASGAGRAAAPAQIVIDTHDGWDELDKRAAQEVARREDLERAVRDAFSDRPSAPEPEPERVAAVVARVVAAPEYRPIDDLMDQAELIRLQIKLFEAEQEQRRRRRDDEAALVLLLAA